jgi:hypothetical protein
MAAISTKVEDQIVINSFIGEITVDGVMHYVQENIEDWIGKPVLWEVSKASFSNISTEEWKKFPRNLGPLSEKRKGSKTALVASEDFPFGMLRMFEILAENEKLAIQFQTFRDINKAKAWLLSSR